MSRIFEALNRQPGELAEAALSPLGVNGPAGALTEQAAAPVAPATEISSSAIRTLPLRIPGGAPTGDGGLDTERHEQDFRSTESTTRRARGSRSIALGR